MHTHNYARTEQVLYKNQMGARIGRIIHSAMSARTSNVSRLVLLAAIVGHLHGVTVEPPPHRQLSTLSAVQHDQFRGAFDPAPAALLGARVATTPLPPQLAYYAKTPATDYASQFVIQPPQQHVSHTLPKKTPPPPLPAIYESDVKAVIEAPSTRIIVRDYAPTRHSSYRVVPVVTSARYRTPSSVGDRFIIRTLDRPFRPQRYGFRPTTGGQMRPGAAYTSSHKAQFLRANGIVRATNPPPGPNDPPPPKPKRPFIPTYQINQQLRKYRQQQLVDVRTPKTTQSPIYRHGAMHEVEPPNLKIRERPLRAEIDRLKQLQRQNFGVADDEHPAEAGQGDDSNETGTKQNREVYRVREQEYDSVRDEKPVTTFKASQQFSGSKFPGKSTTEKNTFRPSTPSYEGYSKHKFAEPIRPTTVRYDNTPRPRYGTTYRPKLNHETTSTTTESGYETLRDSIDHDIDEGLSGYRTNSEAETTQYDPDYDSLKYHSDPFDNQYKNFVSAEDDADSDEADETAHRDFKVRPTDFKRLVTKPVNYITPVQYSTFHDRSSTDRSSTERNDVDDESVVDEFVPYRMLATVRHTENIEHRPRADAEDAAVREKVHEEGGHIVYSESGYEDEQYDHGDEQRAGVYNQTTKSAAKPISRRTRRSVGHAEFPYYYASRLRVPQLSPLRYSSEEGQRARRAEHFYDTKNTDCEGIDFDDSQVNDRPTDAKQKHRLRGLGDKLDCLRRKYFGDDPLSNPIFKERFVSDRPVTVDDRRRKRETPEIEPITQAEITASNNLTVAGNASLSADSNNQTAPPSLSISSASALVHTLPNVHDTPTVILLNERALARVRDNPAIPLADILGFPEVERSEVFIFDIAKFVPRLFVNAEASGGPQQTSRVQRIESAPATAATTTAEPKAVATTIKLKKLDANGRKRKYDRTAFKSRRPNHNYSKVEKK